MQGVGGGRVTGAGHLLSLRELPSDEIAALVEDAISIKRDPLAYREDCRGKGLLLLLQKTSTRTVLSFSAAISELGGYSVKLAWNETNFSISPIRHEVRYVSRNCDAILARCLKFDDVAEMARYSRVPVINGCCSRYHPTQALADVMTIREVAGSFRGLSVAYVGIHNNVANSLIVACTRLGISIALVTPIVNQQAWDDDLMAEAHRTGLVTCYESLGEAAAVVDFVYTDTWIDMERFASDANGETGQRLIERMAPFRVSRENLAGADPYLMHDMPIHPDLEIDEDLIDSPKSVIFQQSENRLYVAKALLRRLLI
jgi:ornithine carbamoyltransferase